MKKLLTILSFLFVISLQAQESAYRALHQSVQGITGSNKATVFIGLDYDWIATHFDVYLQLDARYTLKDVDFGETQIVSRFVKKVSTSDEHLTLTYQIEKQAGLPGAYGGAEKPVNIIKSVEITGDALSVVHLFEKYWRTKPSIGDQRPGQDAIFNKRLLNDYIVLYKEGENRYKIGITTFNMEIDYQKTYGLNKVD